MFQVDGGGSFGLGDDVDMAGSSSSTFLDENRIIASSSRASFEQMIQADEIIEKITGKSKTISEILLI